MKNVTYLLTAMLFMLFGNAMNIYASGTIQTQSVNGLNEIAEAGSLVVSFTDSKGTHEATGTTGSLKTLIENCEEGDKNIETVTALTVVSGNLNGADIATLRQMAQGNDFIIDDPQPSKQLSDEGFSNPEGWQQGTLANLDLSNAGFEQSDDVYVTVHEYKDEDKTYITTSYSTVTGADLPEFALANCASLRTVVLPTSVVPTAAFYNNGNLEKVTVKGDIKVTKVGIRAFENCDKLTSLTSEENIIDLSAVEGEDLGSYAFHRCDGLTEVKLSPKLTVIPGYCFQECSNLTTMNLSELKDLTFIGYSAFRDSHKFVLGDNGEYHVPSSVTHIGDYAFANIEVTKIWLPKNPEYTEITTGLLGWNSKEFGENCGLEYVWIPNNVTKIDGDAFAFCNELEGIKGSIEEGTKITEIGGRAFAQNFKMVDEDLTRLLQDITVVNGSTFEGCTGLHNINLNDAVNGITDVWGYGFANCTNVTNIDLGKVAHLDDLAFGRDVAVTSITVNTATAPRTPEELTTLDDKNNTVYHDPFTDIPSNQVTITFNGDADAYDASKASGYMSYRNNKVFMRLLTKHLDEDDTEYNVAGQKHADVTLQRTFKAGYNTLAVPFGAPADDNHSVKNAQVFANALFTGSKDHGKISVYRGLRNNVFMFLKYSHLDENPIDEFEPVMVYMTQSDIDNATAASGTSNTVATDYYDLKTLTDGAQYYKFEDVDINCDNGTLYKASELPEFVNTDSKQFTGAYKATDMSWFDGVNDDYAFVGCYKNSNDAMKAGDYFIQTKNENSNFFMAESGKTYRTKAFRGWFTPARNASSTAKPAILSVKVVDEEGNSTTGISSINAVDNETSNGNVYNLNGQLVRHNADTLEELPKGIYLFNGKKIIVK